jgi:hypothetical protein
MSHEGKIIKLLVWSRRWKNGFFVPMHVRLVKEWDLVTQLDFSTRIIYLLYYSQLQSFSMLFYHYHLK